MKKDLIFALLLAVAFVVAAVVSAFQTASAGIFITEIMYAPNGSDTDFEWIELYNNETGDVDLKDWKIDGYNFDDFLLNSGEYVIVARELIDGDDEDRDSFESFWGTNDSLWDENDGFLAIDGYLMLANDLDTIELTGVLSGLDYKETVPYNKSMGAYKNGKTLERASLNSVEFIEGPEKGTPGYGIFSPNSGYVKVILSVENALPEIELLNISGGSFTDGKFQMFSNELVFVIGVNDTNGLGDITSVKANILGAMYDLTRLENLTDSYATYTGSINLTGISAGDYILEIVANDGFGSASLEQTIELKEFLRIAISPETLNLALKPGSEEERTITVANEGNTAIDIKISASFGAIGIENIMVKEIDRGSEEEWQSLDNEAVYSLASGEKKELLLKIKAPNIRSADYYGNIFITAMAKG